jgi:hypothetical protein
MPCIIHAFDWVLRTIRTVDIRTLGMACINNITNSLNLGAGLSILPLVGEALPAHWAGSYNTIFLFASWRHNYTKESLYLGHGGMGRTYTGSGVRFGGGLCNGRGRTVTLRIRASHDDDPIKYMMLLSNPVTSDKT